MRPLGLNANQLAQLLHVAPSRITEIVNGKRGITAETALRLSKIFSTSPRFWLELQTSYDLKVAQAMYAEEIDQIIEPIGRPIRPSRLPEGKQAKNERKLPPQLDAMEKNVFDALGDKPVHFDVLMERLGLEVGELSAALTLLELEHLIERRFGDMFVRVE